MIDDNFIMNHSLLECLQEFKGAANGKTVQEREDSLKEPFTILANKILHGGYFLISSCDNKKFRIYIHSVEFYYHEELGDNKSMAETSRICDWIMYHRNPLTGKKKETFKTGTLHPHDSGIDITFEDQNENPELIRYRASALIRSFQVTKGNNRDFVEFDSFPPHIVNHNKTVEYYPTHLKYYLLSQFPFNKVSIEWIGDNEMVSDLYKGKRINVFESTWDTKENGQIFNLKKTGIRDKREWAFSKELIEMTFDGKPFNYHKIM